MGLRDNLSRGEAPSLKAHEAVAAPDGATLGFAVEAHVSAPRRLCHRARARRGRPHAHQTRQAKAFFVFIGRFIGIRTGIETGKIAWAEARGSERKNEKYSNDVERLGAILRHALNRIRVRATDCGLQRRLLCSIKRIKDAQCLWNVPQVGACESLVGAARIRRVVCYVMVEQFPGPCLMPRRRLFSDRSPARARSGCFAWRSTRTGFFPGAQRDKWS